MRVADGDSADETRRCGLFGISLGTEDFRILEGRSGKKETMEEIVAAMLEYYNPVESVNRKRDRLFMIQQGGMTKDIR